MSIRLITMYILSLPLLLFGIIVDLAKLPFVMLVFLPLWGLLDLICILRGEKAMLPEMIWVSSTIGIRLWCMTVGLNADW